MSGLSQKLKSPPVVWAALLLLSLWLRWPFPEPLWQHVDEQAFVDYPLGFWSGDLNPHFFNYPTFHFYLLSLVYYLYFLLFGSEPLTSFIAYRYFVEAGDLIAIARGVSTAMSVGTVAVAMCLGQRLYGARGAYLAGLILATMPLHVRFSHLAITDVPASFWMSLALLWAVRLVQEGRRSDCLLAGVFAGLAGATKYPALLAGLPMLGAAWWRWPMPKKTGFWLAGAAAVASFALATPYIWLDRAHFWADLSAMGQEHLLDAGHRGAEPSWLHLLHYHLRYGLGLAGSCTLALALLWKPRAWRPEEWVLMAALIGFAAFLIIAQSAFMRYALPLAPLAAVLTVRPLLGLSPSRLALAGWLAALLAEPAYASLQTRALLSGPDTRTQIRRWLGQHPEEVRLVQGPDRAGDVEVLTSTAVYARQYRFIQSFSRERLSQAYELLSQRPDLPPFYLSSTLDEVRDYALADPAQASGTAVLLWCGHPLCRSGEKTESLPASIYWQEEFSPGTVERAVFDQADWYFLPIGGWSAIEQTGPAIRLGKILLRQKDAAPTAQEFFWLLHHLLMAKQAAAQKDWPQAMHFYETILSTPFFRGELLTVFLLYEMYMDLGMACQDLGALEEAIRFWLEAARTKPAQAEPYHRLGIAYSQLRQHAKAAQYFQQATALDPEDPDILYNLGVTCVELKHYPEAIAALEKCIALKAEPDAYVNLGVLYGHAGQREQALASFRKALELAPDHPQAAAIRRELQIGP